MPRSDSFGTIDHEGIVQKKDSKSVSVIITAVSACSGCHAEGSCTLSGKEEKIIDIEGSYDVIPGDKVTILMKQSMGYAALLLGYVFPVIAVILVLILMISLKVPELYAGLSSIAILIPYYIVLFFSRNGINKKFTFTLKV
jgi:sigma-E factor negative regulatory protein RseC